MLTAHVYTVHVYTVHVYIVYKSLDISEGVREWESGGVSEEWSGFRLISSLCIYLYIAELIGLHEIKSAMDIVVIAVDYAQIT